MLNTLPELRDLLKDSPLADRQMVELPIPQSPATALAIETNLQTYLEDWRWLRGCLPETGRWPLVVDAMESFGIPWLEKMAKTHLLSRGPFGWEVNDKSGHDNSPEAFIARAAGVDPLPNLRMAVEVLSLNDPADFVDSYVQETSDRFGRAPDATEIRALIAQGAIKTVTDLEKWVFDWECRELGLEIATAPIDTSYLAPYEPSNDVALVLLPTPNSWDALAYVYWWGSGTAGTATAISLLRSWHARFGAELYAHYFTMLEFFVARRPATPDEAFQLAWEQQAIAQCTTALPGVSLNDHARVLMHIDRWFLHERP